MKLIDYDSISFSRVCLACWIYKFSSWNEPFFKHSPTWYDSSEDSLDLVFVTNLQSRFLTFLQSSLQLFFTIERITSKTSKIKHLLTSRKILKFLSVLSDNFNQFISNLSKKWSKLLIIQTKSTKLLTKEPFWFNWRKVSRASQPYFPIRRFM